MKKSIVLILYFGLTILLLGCATMDRISDPKGNFSIINESDFTVILFVNGNYHKKIPSKIGQVFKVSLTPEMAQNNNERVQVDIYREDIFEQEEYELTVDIKDDFIYSLQIDPDSISEIPIEKENITSTESNQDKEKIASQELIFRFPSDANPYLVELYSDSSYITRLIVGSLIPGDRKTTFINPETMTDITIYAKYIRNDGKGTEEIARGQVDTIFLGGPPQTIDIPVDPKYLINPKFNEVENF